MYTPFRSIMNIPQCKRLKLLAGEEGLDRRLAWARAVSRSVDNENIFPGELVFLTGTQGEFDLSSMRDTLKMLAGKKAAGLVLNTSVYKDIVPEEILELSDSLQFPLLKIPKEENIVEVIQAICKKILDDKKRASSMTDLMKSLLFDKPSEYLAHMAVFFGYRTKLVYYGVVVDIDHFKDYLGQKQITGEEEINKLKMTVMGILEDAMLRYNKKILYLIDSDSFLLMIPVAGKEAGGEVEIRMLGEKLCQTVAAKIPGMTVSVGIGNPCYKLEDFKQSILEAKKSLQILKACKRTNSVRCYDELGVYRLFFKVPDEEELLEIYYDTVGPLIEYDRENNTELLRTLEIYLEEDENISKAAQRMYLHRNTLKYRIAKIQEVLGYNFENVNQLFNLRLAFKIKKFLYIS